MALVSQLEAQEWASLKNPVLDTNLNIFKTFPLHSLNIWYNCTRMDADNDISCPICGKPQKKCGRECNQCFKELIKSVDGTVPPDSRRYPKWKDDKEDMNKGVFICPQTYP